MSKNNLLAVDLSTLAPMENYEAPELPTLTEVKPELLEKVPSRWKKKAVIATTVGLLGATTLTGCNNIHYGGGTSAPIYVTSPTENEIFGQVQNQSFLENRDLCWMHHGGAGGAPLYVAYLTEQEAINIIHTELARAGINFTQGTFPYYVEIEDEDSWWDGINRIEVGLLNEENNIALSVLNPTDFHIPFGRFDMNGITDSVYEQFNEHYPHLTLGLFCNPEDWWYDDINEARQGLEENLIAQVHEFIEQLRANGNID